VDAQVPGQLSYYVDASSGDDAATGRDADPWKTLKRVADCGWEPGYQGGSTIYLRGTFVVSEESKFFFQLDKSFGNATHPIRITSWVTAEQSEPATIFATATHGISIYSWTVKPGGLGFQIDNLKIIGDGNLLPSGKTTSGIFLTHDAPGNIDWFRVYNVEVSGFTEAGLFTFRGNYSQNATGWITNVAIQKSTFHDNPSFPGLYTPSGSGIVLSGVKNGLIEDCEAYHNGAKNTNPGGGPVGIWAYDADNVLINRCVSHDNLSQNNDGGGFDFDIGVTNSVLQNCKSYYNWGPGYEACALTGTDNNAGSTRNVTIKDSTSEGDGYGKDFTSLGIFPDDTKCSVSDVLIKNLTVVIDSPHACNQWGSDYAVHSGLWLFAQGGKFSNIQLQQTTIVCKQQGKTFTNDLVCDSSASPPCRASVSGR